MSRRIGKQAFWGLAFTLAILCVVSLVSFRTVHSLISTDEERSRNFRLISALQLIESEFMDADTAERGFLLTNDPKYLIPFNASLANQQTTFQRLRALTVDDTASTQLLSRLEHLARRKQDEMQHSIELRGSVGFDAAVQIILTGEGTKIMNEIRAVLTDLVAQQTKALEIRDQNVRQGVRAAKAAMLLGTLAALLVTISSLFFIWQGIRERERASSLLRVAHEELEHKVLERTSELKIANSSLQSEVVFRQNAESELKKQQHFLQALLDSLDEGIVACDREGQITLLNPATRRLFGLPQGETPTPYESWDEYCVLLNVDGTTPISVSERPLSKTLRGEAVRNLEMIIVRQGTETRNILASGQQIVDEQGQRLGAVVAFRDITEIKRSEEAIRAQQTAEASNRAKSEFLSRMSHELRTPLNAILGFAQLLQMDKLPPDQMESIDQILKGGRHLLSLINEVLDISRIEAGRLAISPEPVLVSEAISEVVGLVAPIAKQEQIAVEVPSTWSDERHVMADRQRIKQVLLNLLSNAVKYNHVGGWVRIAYEKATRERIRISVSDSGSGVPPDRIHRLFTPFDRLGADQSGIEGTGLGLCLSKGLVELMGGEMGFHTLEGQGSTFWFELHAVESPVDKLGSVPLTAQGTTASCRRLDATILYIEDNLSNLRLVERILRQREGVTLIPAMSGRLGVELASQHKPNLIFLDLNLPDIHGTEVLSRLKHDPVTSKIPVIVISADATPGQIQNLLLAGACNYLTKPINIVEFLRELDAVTFPPESIDGMV